VGAVVRIGVREAQSLGAGGEQHDRGPADHLHAGDVLEIADVRGICGLLGRLIRHVW
jgi:hypothetical protein